MSTSSPASRLHERMGCDAQPNEMSAPALGPPFGPWSLLLQRRFPEFDFMLPLRPNPLSFLDVATRRARLRKGLVLLRDALEGAADLHLTSREFAIEVAQLHAAGLTNTDLRWLIGKGFVEHLCERPTKARGPRLLRKAHGLSISQASCFVLTPAGDAAASLWPGPSAEDRCPPGEPEGNGSARTSIRPKYDAGFRELWWNGVLVKRFRQPALNQETILSAFQEEGWPPRLDDPLPGSREADPRVRLHDAIKGLNRNQANPCLHFGGDGTGRSIVWTATRKP